MTRLFALTLACVLPQHALAQDNTRVISNDGTITLTGEFTMPPSSLVSPEAQAIMLDGMPTEGNPAMGVIGADVPEYRKLYNETLQPRVDHTIDLFPVTVEETEIGGISAARILPEEGVRDGFEDKVIINVPGGGWRTAIRGNGLLVGVPIAHHVGVEVVSISYRQAPEYLYPAASEDLKSVYDALLEEHDPEDIGMVGCSAGGSIIAQTVAQMIIDGEETPAVLGVYCGAASGTWGGDSFAYVWGMQTAYPTTAPSAPDSAPGYYDEADRSSAVFDPVNHPEVASQFPPTFFATGTRDFGMSASLYSHRKLLEAGVDAQIMAFDGLYHGFMTNPDLPESRTLFEVSADFYARHLSN
ncbi:alpha/beta hydrolase [Salipiger sp. IMCC34102]|uniref:alpha/beta hydrolase n=1 Tax=Salipiger sp. IMCC34102 TaxID=2510647 RepID=UPI00101B98E9|nr:alpha/beta hydrolase [Salipiger sp. IMCC34102]RYH04455.1 alpha/beta hydrolase [Salipiger sp. IMCC34102]